VADGGDFGLDGFGGAGCGLNLLDLVSEVAVHEAVEEVEVDNLPRYDIEDAGDEGDANADGEGATEGDGAVGEVVPVGADAEEDKEEGEDDGGVAKVITFVAVVEVAEEGMVPHIMTEERTPEMRPKVRMVFFNVGLLWRWT
jgi:hypothetical protein